MYSQKCQPPAVYKVPDNNSPTAALQITVEAERKHIFSLLFCTRVPASPCGDDINDKSPSWVRSFSVFINFWERFILVCAGRWHFEATLAWQENEAVGRCVLPRGIHRCPVRDRSGRAWSFGAQGLTFPLQHPSHWATGCLKARGTTSSCYTRCSSGEKVTFLHRPLLSNTDIH